MLNLSKLSKRTHAIVLSKSVGCHVCPQSKLLLVFTNKFKTTSQTVAYTLNVLLNINGNDLCSCVVNKYVILPISECHLLSIISEG